MASGRQTLTSEYLRTRTDYALKMQREARLVELKDKVRAESRYMHPDGVLLEAVSAKLERLTAEIERRAEL